MDIAVNEQFPLPRNIVENVENVNMKMDFQTLGTSFLPTFVRLLPEL